METPKSKIVWGTEVNENNPPSELTKAQVASIRHILLELPLGNDEIRSWRVEYTPPTKSEYTGKTYRHRAFLIAETGIKNERGAQFLCRENYFFTIGVNGGIEQSKHDRFQRPGICKHRPGRRW